MVTVKGGGTGRVKDTGGDTKPKTDADTKTKTDPNSGQNTGGGVEENTKLSPIDNPVDLTNGRSGHILTHHKAGAGKPDKSEFPSNWDDQRIIHNASDVATDPNAVRGVDPRGTPYAEGVRDGVKIRVTFFPDNHARAGQISSAYPPDLPKNPR